MTDTQTDTFEQGIGVLGTRQNRQTDNKQINDPITVNGVLIPEDTIVEGGQGVRHWFPAGVLAEAERVISEQLDEDTIHIVKNFHDVEGQAPADDIIGQLTGVRHSPDIGLLFEGEVADRDIAEKVANGYLSVSPSIARALGEFDPQREARPVESVAGLRDAAIVGRGQPGATVELGPNPSVGTLARDALSRAFDGDLDTLSVSEPEINGYDEGAWPPGGASSVTLEGTFDGDMDAARNSATWIDGEGEDFEDLSLFVLNAAAELNVNALDSAWVLASQTDGPTEDDVERLRALYEDLAVTANDAGAITDDEFDTVWQDRIGETDTNESDTMSLDDAKETIADEYGIEIDELEARLDDDAGPDEDDDRVILVEQ